MLKNTNYIALSLILCCSLFLSACSSNDNTESEGALSSETNIANSTADVSKIETTTMQEKDSINSKMPDLENVQLDVNNPETLLAMNAKKKGVTTTASGLQYRVLTQGTGPKPSTDSVVQVHYRGTFPNGEEFDSSYKRGEPATFPVTGVIAGWTEALLLMNQGSKYELVIPSDLAYGKRGAGNVIPPNQVLKFDVELLNANFKK